MRLAPNTSSPAYLEAFVSTCMEAGVPEDVTAEHFHTLRVKEACAQSDDFAEGFEKEARGLWGAAASGGYHLMKGLGKGVFGKNKGLMRSLGSEAKAWSRVGQKGKPFITRSGLGTDVGLTLGGGLGYTALTGRNPLTGVDLNPFDKKDLPTGPSWTQIDAKGRMGVNPEGDLNSILQMRQQTKHIDKQIASMEAQRQILGKSLAERSRARQLENRIKELQKARTAFGRSFNSSFGDFERSGRKFQNQLSDALRNYEQGNSKLQGQIQDLEDYYNNTDNSWFQRIMRGLPVVGADAQSDRLLERQRALQEQYNRAQQLQNQWNTLNRRLGY